MELSELKKKVDDYLERDMVFSAKETCEDLLKLEHGEYWLFKYADILRLCASYSKSEAIFLSINIDNIPAKYRYYYYLYLGQLYIDMSKGEAAKTQLVKCMDFEACDTAPYIFMASLLLQEEKVDASIGYLQMALERIGDIDEVYYNLATRLAIKGDIQEALTAIEDCLKLDPNYPNAQMVKFDLLELTSLRISRYS